MMAQRVGQQRRPQLATQAGELAQRVDRLLTGLRVALAQLGQDQLLEQRGLAIGRLAPGAQVAAFDTTLQEARGGAQVPVYKS